MAISFPLIFNTPWKARFCKEVTYDYTNLILSPQYSTSLKWLSCGNNLLNHGFDMIKSFAEDPCLAKAPHPQAPDDWALTPTICTTTQCRGHVRSPLGNSASTWFWAVWVGNMSHKTTVPPTKEEKTIRPLPSSGYVARQFWKYFSRRTSHVQSGDVQYTTHKTCQTLCPADVEANHCQTLWGGTS